MRRKVHHGRVHSSFRAWAVAMPSISPFKRMSMSTRSNGVERAQRNASSPELAMAGTDVAQPFQPLLHVVGNQSFVFDDEDLFLGIFGGLHVFSKGKL